MSKSNVPVNVLQFDEKLLKHYDVNHSNQYRITNAGRAITLYLQPANLYRNTITTFRVSKNNLDMSVIYGFLFTTIIRDLQGERYVQRAVTLGPSLNSRDGEYRGNMLGYEHFQPAFESSEYKNAFDDIDVYLTTRLEQLKIRTAFESLHPHAGTQKNITFQSNIISNRTDIKIFIGSWLVVMFDFYNGTPISHINQKYLKILDLHLPAVVEFDLKFLRSIFIKYPGSEEFLYKFVTLFAFNTRVSIGQKITPMSKKDMQSLFSVSRKVWRELLLSRYLSDLTLNCISYAFPIAGLFSCPNINVNRLFDNEIQLAKYENSEIAKKIMHELKRAQMYTLSNIDESSGIFHKFDKSMYNFRPKADRQVVQDVDPNIKEISVWLSEKFESLHEKIQDPIDYLEGDMLMAEHCMVTMSEHVGPTFYNILNIMSINKKIEASYTNPTATDEQWSLYVFDVLSGLLAMNLRAGAIHMDLHLNNITLLPRRYPPKEKRTEQQENQAIYYAALDPKHSQALFEYELAESRPISQVTKWIPVYNISYKPTEAEQKMTYDSQLSKFMEYVKDHDAKLPPFDATLLPKPSSTVCIKTSGYHKFPKNNYQGMVIDFSRSIIHPAIITKLVDFNLLLTSNMLTSAVTTELNMKIPDILPEGEKKKFAQDQANRVMNTYKLFFPEFHAKNEAVLQYHLENNFDKLFYIFTAIDSYKFTGDLAIFCSDNKMTNCKFYKLICQIRDKSEYWLTTFLETQIKARTVPTEVTVWPIAEIIREFYKDFHVSEVKGEIGDISDITMVKKWSYETYETSYDRIWWHDPRKYRAPFSDIYSGKLSDIMHLTYMSGQIT